MNHSELESLGNLLFALVTGLTYIICQPLKRIPGSKETNKPGTVPITPYLLVSFACLWAIFLASVLSWLISRFSSSVYWVTVIVYILVAFAAYGLFHKGLAGRIFSGILCGTAALISVSLNNSRNPDLTAGGAGLWLLPVAVLSIFLFRHRRDYVALWRSGIIDSRKRSIIAVIGVYYIIVFTVKFLI
jgi:hypothetical protein